jgi:hypothetical protein
MYSKLSGCYVLTRNSSEPFLCRATSTIEVDSCTKCNAHAHLMICEAARRHGWDIEQVTSLIASKDRT